MMKQIIKFVEENVDGCGGRAEVMVAIETEIPLTHRDKERLSKAIEDIRNEWEADEWDTDSVVYEAIARVFGNDADYTIICPDITVEF